MKKEPWSEDDLFFIFCVFLAVLMTVLITMLLTWD